MKLFLLLLFVGAAAESVTTTATFECSIGCSSDSQCDPGLLCSATQMRQLTAKGRSSLADCDFIKETGSTVCFREKLVANPACGSALFDREAPTTLPRITGFFNITLTGGFCMSDPSLSWQRLIDFGNGGGDNNILLTQIESGTDLALQIYLPGRSRTRVRASNVIVPGEIAVWTVIVNAPEQEGVTNSFIYKNGLLVGEGRSLVPADIERTRRYIGKSNFAGDKDLVGYVGDLEVTQPTLVPGQVPTCRTPFNHEVPATVPRITGFFNITLTAGFCMFDPSLNFQRLFDFGRGAGDHNILLTQIGSGTDLGLQIYLPGRSRTRVTASNVIVPGEIAVWTVIVNAPEQEGVSNGFIYKNGVLVGEGRSLVPADVERTKRYIGKSNFLGDKDLVGYVADLEVTNL